MHMALVLHRTSDYLLGLTDEPTATSPTVQAGDNSAVNVAIGNNIKQTIAPPRKRNPGK